MDENNNINNEEEYNEEDSIIVLRDEDGNRVKLTKVTDGEYRFIQNWLCNSS